ncbi:restriction endonuclease subunit S [Pseudonocardia halophobica]|uniref:Type I site-specific deoxyribonuclease n=1 Tax=Pseudonocardia halophobica TaxID=29401 RepID=A0A9W6NXL1_9PSEU|nr:type I site-specific deoxyribonuclease [Pseudonocardia halophobica]
MASSTSGLHTLSVAKLKKIALPLPTLEEQRRIVVVLEGHLSRLDAAAATLAVAAQRLHRLQERLVLDAITGSSHDSERSECQLAGVGSNDGNLPDLPMGWTWSRLGDVADVVGGVTKDAKKQADPGFIEVPYLRVANVQRGRLDLSDVARIRVSPSKAEALSLRPGDVLLNEGGDRDKLARGWVWEGQIEHCIHQNHVFRARVRNPRLDPYFLSWTTNTIGGRWAERNGKQSVNLASISLSMIRRMPVIVPASGHASVAIARLRDELDSMARLREEIARAETQNKALRRAVLAAAFTGALSCRTGEVPVSDESVVA